MVIGENLLNKIGNTHTHKTETEVGYSDGLISFPNSPPLNRYIQLFDVSTKVHVWLAAACYTIMILVSHEMAIICCIE